MTSNRKVFNRKIVRLVETVDFDIKIILIQVYATRGSKTTSKTEGAESFRTDRVDLIGETELVRKITRELAMFTR